MESIHDAFRRAGLVRPQQGALLGGVCAGIARRLGIDPWPTRILFVALLLAVPGSQILIYPILWVLMPAEQTVPATMTPMPASMAPMPDFMPQSMPESMPQSMPQSMPESNAEPKAEPKAQPSPGPTAGPAPSV